MYLIYLCILSALCLPLCSAYAAQIGINISLPERGGTFVDVVKENFRWQDIATGQELGASQLDDKGWPEKDAQYVIDWRPVAEWLGSIDDPDAYRIDASGTYRCSFIGEASVSVVTGGTIQNKTYTSGTNTTAFDLVVPGPPGAGHGLIFLNFTGTMRTPTSPAGSGITGLRILRPGYPHDTDKIFTDDFINSLSSADFSAIRFMGFTMTNDAEPAYPGVTNWNSRKMPDDASQDRISAIGKLDGAAWEYVVRLANIVRTDIWINIPVSASTDYVTRLAQMLEDSLDSNLKIYVESSNEVWNTAPGFNQSTYNKAQAQARGIGEHENHARRTIELARKFESVFGPGSLNGRVRVILCSHQPMLKWWVEPMLTYVNGGSGPPRDFIYAIACQTYFEGGADAGESITDFLADCHESITGQIDGTGTVNEAGRKQWIAKAAAWNLAGGFCSYEGGPSHAIGSTVNLTNRIRAERDSRMADEVKYNLDEAFSRLGGSLAMYFTLSSAYNRYGCWGLTDDISRPDRNFKFGAVRELLATGTAVENENEEIPSDFRLYQNYPNPFNPVTAIAFFLPHPAFAELTIFDALGRKIRVLSREYFSGGMHTITWDGRDAVGRTAASGVYFYRLNSGKFTETRKLLLVH